MPTIGETSVPIDKGKSGGGTTSYGYRVVRRKDTEGEPMRGELEIVAREAAIVRRIFRDYAAGHSPRGITRRLNAEGIASPQGRQWSSKTLRGYGPRSTGILNNELYIGRRVWLLSGLLYCGCCGGTFVLRGQDRLACSAHVSKSSCSNSRTIRRTEMETRVLAGLKDRIMTPDAAEEAMRAYAEETNRLNRERRTSGEADRAELGRIEKAMREIVQAIEDGGYTRMLTERLRELEARQDTLKERLATTPERCPTSIPTSHIFTAAALPRS